MHIKTCGAVTDLQMYALLVCVCSTQTPPGTKVLLLHKVEVQKGFILLDKHSLKILGGNVDHLIQKWTVTKVILYEPPQNIGTPHTPSIICSNGVWIREDLVLVLLFSDNAR